MPCRPPRRARRAGRALALPERDRARPARRRGDDDAVARDLLDPPGGRAEQERLAGAGLVDHLLVELADPPPPSTRWTPKSPRSGIVPALVTASRRAPSRPRIDARRCGPRRSAAAARRTRRTGSGPRACRARSRAGRARGRRTGRRGARARSSSSTSISSCDAMATICWARTSSGLRGIWVSSISPSCIRADDHRGLEQVGAELREDASLETARELVAGAADPLQAARDRLRRLDLDDEVDGAHVDAELERRRRDEARDLARASAAPRPRAAARARASRGGRARSPSRPAR